jgi:hypothetical protein
MKTNLSLIRNKHFEILKGYRTARTRKPLNNKHDREQMEEKLIIIEKKCSEFEFHAVLDAKSDLRMYVNP